MAFDSSIISFTTKTDKVDLVSAAHINAVQNELVTIETILGTGLKGTATDLATRLNKALDSDGSILSGTAFPSPALTSQQFWRTDLNVLYIFTGSQWIPQSGVTSYVAGTYLIAGPTKIEDASSTSYTKIAEFYIPRSGTISTKFGISTSGCGGSGKAYGCVYKNGSAIGTERSLAIGNTWTEYSEDITVSSGDLIQLYIKRDASLTGSNLRQVGGLRLYESTPPTEILGSGGQTKNGFQIWTGVGVPVNALGNDGDLYLSTTGAAAASLYIKNSGTWNAR